MNLAPILALSVVGAAVFIKRQRETNPDYGWDDLLSLGTANGGNPQVPTDYIGRRTNAGGGTVVGGVGTTSTSNLGVYPGKMQYPSNPGATGGATYAPVLLGGSGGGDVIDNAAFRDDLPERDLSELPQALAMAAGMINPSAWGAAMMAGRAFGSMSGLSINNVFSMFGGGGTTMADLMAGFDPAELAAIEASSINNAMNETNPDLPSPNRGGYEGGWSGWGGEINVGVGGDTDVQDGGEAPSASPSIGVEVAGIDNAGIDTGGWDGGGWDGGGGDQ